MAADMDDGCAEVKGFLAIDAAFKSGDLDALRAAVGDPALVPNGCVSDLVGSCLVYAIYHSPLAFIRTLLEMGADPNAPVDDGFPPLIAALTCGREVPGATRRSDVDEIVRLLLAFGADPNQRGINDYTALHMAVPSVVRSPCTCCSRAAPIQSCARGSTSARRHARWRRPPASVSLPRCSTRPRGPDARGCDRVLPF